MVFNDESEGALKKLALAGGPATTIAETGLPAGGFWGATWGEDGTIVYATSGGLMRTSDIGGVAEPLRTVVEGSIEQHMWPHFLPGGEDLLFVITGPGPNPPMQIAMLSVATGQIDTLTTGTYPHFVEPGYLVYLRGNTLWAAPFDPGRRALTGDGVPAVDGVVGGIRSFSVTPKGTLVFTPVTEQAGTPRTLVWVDRDGQEQAVPLPSQPYVYPRISPDGGRLAIAVPQDVLTLGSSADLWVFDLDRFARSRITFGGNNRFFPVWTRDGARLTYADSSGVSNRVLRSAADGTGTSDTLLALGDRRFPTSWSPDGRTLAYYVGPQGTPSNSRDLWALRMEGAEPRPQSFLATPFNDRAPAFSPDGRWIAYVSDKSGRDEVYVVPYPGPGPEATVSTEGGTEPVWSRDGTELFYRSDNIMMAVDVTLGGAFRAGMPRPLFADVYERDRSGGSGGTPNYDVAADGRFVMVRGTLSGPSEVIVVLDWIEELRRLLPN